MTGSQSVTNSSKRTQDIIFGTAVFLAAIIIFMCICHSTRGTATADESAVEPPLSADHAETVHVGNNIPSEEREKAHRDGEKSLRHGEVKWNLRKAKREADRVQSIYEQDDKVVKPDRPGDGGAL